MIMENIVLFTEVVRKYKFSRKTKIQVQYILANWLIKQAKLEYKRGNKLLSFNNLLRPRISFSTISIEELSLEISYKANA